MPDHWIAIDFETATSERASACALGLAVIEGDRIVERRDWLIRPPGNRYEWRNTHIHGIDARMTAGKPELDGLWPEIEPYLYGSVVLAHNASFDMGVLRASLSRYRLDDPGIAGYHCTVTMARRTWPDLHNHQLSTVCRYCGIELVHHEAASDANACASIALRCLEQSGERTLDDLAIALRLRRGTL
jgi:DNA polymerase-3 subunit epsilon